jgi:hypothetical protein
MAAGRLGAVLVAVVCSGGFACAHLGSRAPERASLAAGKYSVESIRSRAQLDGSEQLIEISETGVKMLDANGAEHVLTERGALLLDGAGGCRLALAVSVDGEEPGVSDRRCTWRVDGDQFFLGDESGTGTRTVYVVKRAGNRVVLEGMHDIDESGHVVGDARGERIVLVEGVPTLAQRTPIDRTSEEQAVREIAESLHEM